ncbi:MAG: hypothetical protein Fur0039_07730 [Rhodocyclaceae bacterium]
MSKHVSKVKAATLAVGLALAAGGAQAVTIAGGLVGGGNTLLDESREVYVDVNNDGLFSIGDVIYGYIRISDFQPKAVTGNNQVYGVFSQQIVGSSLGGLGVFFGPTTVAGLTLADLLGGDPNVNAAAIAGFYDRPAPYVDIINANPPGPPANMEGYIDYIRNNGTLRVVAGFSDPDDFLFSLINPLTGASVGGSNAAFVGLPTSITVASNSGAFSVSYNNTPFIFQDLVPVAGPGGPVLAEVAVSSGTTAGTGNPADGFANPLPQNWLESGYAGAAQCTAPDAGGIPRDTNCGFIDKNNFSVNVVPEPGSLALLSLALVGVGALTRRRVRMPV